MVTVQQTIRGTTALWPRSQARGLGAGKEETEKECPAPN